MTTDAAPAAIAPFASLIVAKYAGTCACGAAVKVGAKIAYTRSLSHQIIGCMYCDFGTFPGMDSREIDEIYDDALTAAYDNRRRDPALARRMDARAQLCVDAMERLYQAQCEASLRGEVIERRRNIKR